MKSITVILTILIGVSALAGDYVVFQSKFSSSKAFQAFSDNSVHAFIGFLSAVTFFSHDNHNTTSTVPITYNIAVCTAVASFIDVDHVFIAKSFYLKDLTSLNRRGIFHCTTIWIVISSVLIFLSYYTKNFEYKILGFMLLIASISHHLRDANRRGMWFWPYGHTAPLSTTTYIFVTSLLPNIIHYVHKYMKVSPNYSPVTYINV